MNVLPIELWMEILGRCDPRSFIRFCNTCQSARVMFSDELLWKSICRNADIRLDADDESYMSAGLFAGRFAEILGLYYNGSAKVMFERRHEPGAKNPELGIRSMFTGDAASITLCHGKFTILHLAFGSMQKFFLVNLSKLPTCPLPGRYDILLAYASNGCYNPSFIFTKASLSAMELSTVESWLKEFSVLQTGHDLLQQDGYDVIQNLRLWKYETKSPQLSAAVAEDVDVAGSEV